MTIKSSDPILPIPIRPIPEPLRPILLEPAIVSKGQGVLRGTWFFDFESGAESSNLNECDVWWEQQTNVLRQMTSMNGASVYVIGIVDYDSIYLSNLQELPYSTMPIPANVSDTNMLPNNSVFAVRTRHGRFTKVQVIQYDYNLNIRWVTYARPIHYLDVKVTLGSTPEWLVTRYIVQCTYNTPNGIQYCGTGTFGYEGGIIQGQISDEAGSFPPFISVNISIDFEPDTNLQALQKTFTPSVTDTGVNYIFEPFQVIQKTDVLLDLQITPETTDYLLLRWQHHNNSGTIYLWSKESLWRRTS